jgi:uncharacterized membrane protein
MLIAGIIAVAARKSRGAGIVCLIFYVIAGIVGVTMYGIYKDLIVWGIVSFIFAIIFLIGVLTHKKQNRSSAER